VRRSSIAVGDRLIVLCLCTRSPHVLHAIHRGLVTHTIRDMHTSWACSVWWCHLVLLTIHLCLIGPLRLEDPLLHAIWHSVSLAINRGTCVGLHLCLRYTTTHPGLVDMVTSLSSSSSSSRVLSIWQTLVIDLLRPTRLRLRALWMMHVRSRAVGSIAVGMRLLIRHLAVALHLSLALLHKICSL